MSRLVSTFTQVAVVSIIVACALISGCGQPSNDELCEVAADIQLREKPDRKIGERFHKQCKRKVQNMRLDAGVLRFGGVARCMKEAQSTKDFYACGVDDKPPPRH